MSETMMKPHYKVLPSDEGIDRMTVEVVPRYKQSGLSGDEWRTSVVVKMYRKGVLAGEQTYGSMKAAMAGIAWHFTTVHEDSPMPLWGTDEHTCHQYGCDQEAVRVVRLKQQFSAQGEGPLPIDVPWEVRRAFCVRHQQRGDASREDSEQNYETVERPL